MQAKELSVFEFLNEVSKIITPNNHREFCFDISDAKNFLETIKSSDFLGVFTLKQTQKENEYILIDGYSRLLLFSLLICALNNNNIKYENFVSQLQENIQKNLKVNFLNSDNEFYKAISTNFFENLEDCPKNLSDIYNLFLENTSLNKKKTSNLIKRIMEIKAIFLIVEDEKISIQKLYESLNSTSKKLSEYEQIKNLVFDICAEKNKNSLFTNYFLQIEKEYSQQGINEYLIPFIKDYLTIQNNGKIPQENQIYLTFKNFMKKFTRIRSLELILENLYRYSKYYAQIITENIVDFEIQSEIQIINHEKAYDAYPYLMEVFEDWDKNHVNKEMLIDILKMVNLFIQQRKEPNASKFVMTFAKLSTQINKMLALKAYTPRITDEEILTINKIMQS